ncbi:dienelactone hydrolase family protein [Sorangium sp. So ce341]|uniref:dienelactone hydrolase family protein n=1 Tax=Sorangium sp. So ce341 TaxID=3133302 RepID=UPI003F5F07F6
MSRTTVTLKTRDGQTEASIFRPDAGEGPWPAVLVYHDGRGIRPALFELGSASRRAVISSCCPICSIAAALTRRRTPRPSAEIPSFASTGSRNTWPRPTCARTPAFQQAGVRHTVETYAGAKHGWVPSDSAVYNQAASERHYQTLLALFDATLKSAPPKR